MNPPKLDPRGDMTETMRAEIVIYFLLLIVSLQNT